MSDKEMIPEVASVTEQETVESILEHNVDEKYFLRDTITTKILQNRINTETKNSWIGDTGSTHHITNSIEGIYNVHNSI